MKKGRGWRGRMGRGKKQGRGGRSRVEERRAREGKGGGRGLRGERNGVSGLWKRQLVTKLHVRKRMSGGSRMARNCICGRRPAGLQEVCALWLRVRRRIRAGERLFPNPTDRSLPQGRSYATQLGGWDTRIQEDWGRRVRGERQLARFLNR